MTDCNDPMAEIRASFFIECEELLEALQDGLEAMNEGTDDYETINVIFRAVHSIKGGAGAFGVEALVRFAHRFETVLVEIRAGRITPNQHSLKLLFQCSDHLSDLVRISRDKDSLLEEKTSNVLKLLDKILGDNTPTDTAEADDELIDFQPAMMNLDLDLSDDCQGSDMAKLDLPELPKLSELPPITRNQFRIRFTPQNELFQTGNEPFHMLRALENMGVCTVTCHTEKVPILAELSPENAYLSWTVEMTSSVNEAEIASAFEFVEGLCELEITQVSPTASNVAQQASEAHTGSGAAEKTAHEVAQLAASVGAKPTRPASRKAPPKVLSAATPAKSVVRVDLDRIERLVNLAGELVITQAMLSQSLESAGLSLHSDAMISLEECQRLTRDIQDSVMMIRAQPVKSLFQRMSRVVREASAAVDKDVRLISEGENTEVDKTVIERLVDPLTHMIRNAVDHGLETTATRVTSGKPAQGQVRLSATHTSGRVIIEVSDDGGGIDRSKVHQIAIDKGFVSPDAVLSECEIDNLLFLPGFSTTTVVSDLSGRGVGMDVVRTSIKELGGRITISSTPGEGTTFSISLPLSLPVLDGMVVQVANETLVLPLDVVMETLTLSTKNVKMVRPGANVVRVRSGFVPLFDLGGALGYRTPLEDYEGSVVLLIAHEDAGRVALIVDSIQDQRQVVIKKLGDSFYQAPGIAAATILADGEIALILDTSDIITNVIGTAGHPYCAAIAGVPT